MSDRELNSLSRMMAGTLRHFPERFDLAMDEHGWVNLFDMVDAFRDARDDFHWLRPRHIQAIVESDEKGRYEIDDEMIRATYAHSVDIDLDLPTHDIPDHLFYPATADEARALLDGGIHATDRRYVHLSKTYKSAWEAGSGKADSPAIIQVDVRAAEGGGIKIMHAASTVYLCDEAPAKYLSMAPEEMITDEEKKEMLARTRPERPERRERRDGEGERRGEEGERGPEAEAEGGAPSVPQAESEPVAPAKGDHPKGGARKKKPAKNGGEEE
jgi:putative RNA 2'-phosphotransferase